MQKNRGDDYGSVQIDPITGEYYIVIPEWIMSELSWYEDTEVGFTLDGDEVVLKERGL